MTSTRRALLRAGGGVLAGGLLAGCVDDSASDGGSADTATESTPSGPQTVTGRASDLTATTRATETTEPTSSGTTTERKTCAGTTGIDFYSLSEGFGWDRRHVAVGYSLGAGAHVQLVAYEGETVLGTDDSRAPDDTGVAVDGQSVPLDEPLTGEHTIRVVMYADPDGDGEFDPASATPCRYEGEVVQAGPETIDFSRFPSSTSTTETD